MIYHMYRQENNGLELGFYIEASEPLSEEEFGKIFWLIAETFEPSKTQAEPFMAAGSFVEIGPRLSIETPFSSNAVSICQAMGLHKITRIERTRLHRVVAGEFHDDVLKKNLDRMTEQHLPEGIKSFDLGILPEPVRVIDVLGHGRKALDRTNEELGLGMDEADIFYYRHLFMEILKRNPTDVGLFQLGNANSEHSRHWFFKGKIIIDGREMWKTLMEVVQAPLCHLRRQLRFGDKDVSLVAFNDNAGVIRGFKVDLLLPRNSGNPSELILAQQETLHITCTAETHNHPTFVAPFPGAATGAGGRIRDTSAVGRGGFIGVGLAGYAFGNLFLPGYKIPGEVIGESKPSKYASPLDILIEGSNGASSYGNEIGEPLTGGFCRSFGQLVSGEWREFRKPILYSAGVGHLFGRHLLKKPAEVGMKIVRIGGPAYLIGVGGGSASSMMQGQNTEALDFNSVQRGNAEMENRANRVIRACVELAVNNSAGDNPIASIHDQGAGGPSNVLTELLEPCGGRINIRKIVLGDKTMSVLQIWSAEFQEGYGFLIWPDKLSLFQAICERERVNCEVAGDIDGSGKVVLEDPETGTTPVDLELNHILTSLPQKTFKSTRRKIKLEPLVLPDITVGEAIEAVFQLPSVGSKGFLVHKVDRSVTGLVAQQQCCGIAQIPIANVSINAQSHFGLTGAASAIGEQPIKMLIDAEAGAIMAVGEMITNMASVKISGLGDIRCRANWMWPAKLPHEGALLYDAAKAMADLMIEIGIAVDGGKDSLSMAATVGDELVKAPGSLVIIGYAPVPDITKKLTPDIKKPGQSLLCLIDLGEGKNRLGGSALAQACNQLGDQAPDISDPKLLKNAFLMVQQMIDEGLALALHDRSDGGLITTVAEMCMASQSGFKLDLPTAADPFGQLFNEELGWVVEIRPENEKALRELCERFGVPFSIIGKTRRDGTCSVNSPGGELWRENIATVRGWWERTSYEIEKLQMNPDCAEIEYLDQRARQSVDLEDMPNYRLTFTPTPTPDEVLQSRNKPKVVILREEGTNGDREMAAACLAGGLQPIDVNMQDMLEGKIYLDNVQGLIFCGGFSYMDVFGSAKGWAATILFNDKLREMFDRFYAREDTFSLGVCNGSQLMPLLNLVPFKGTAGIKQPRFIQNVSRRFESRPIQVEILPSPAMMFDGMVGSRLPVWAAHGEGRMFFPDEEIRQEVLEQNLAPLVCIDSQGKPTEQYPYNPNGSPGGMTALCSPDGRHLAMMPHPERCFRLWQWPFVPAPWRNLEASPWLRMFQNAQRWCSRHRRS